jgi:hypothetical protein
MAQTRWHRPIRRGLAFAMVILGGILLGACEPRATLIIAVYLDNGHPAILVRPCQGHVYDIVVAGHPAQLQFGQLQSADTAASSTSPDDVDRFWDVEDRDRTHPVTETRLLETPTGWRPKLEGLTDFRDDWAYSTWVQITETTPGSIVSLRFTLAGLRGLGADQVWAATQPYEPEQAMSRHDFLRLAERSC